MTSDAIPIQWHNMVWLQGYYGLAMSLLAGSKTPISPVFILQLPEASPKPFLHATIQPSWIIWENTHTPASRMEGNPWSNCWSSAPGSCSCKRGCWPGHGKAISAEWLAQRRRTAAAGCKIVDTPPHQTWQNLRYDMVWPGGCHQSLPFEIAAELLRNVRASRRVMAGVKATAAAPVFTRIVWYQWSSIVPMNCCSETHVVSSRILDGLTCVISMHNQVTQAQPCSSVGTSFYLYMFLNQLEPGKTMILPACLVVLSNMSYK